MSSAHPIVLAFDPGYERLGLAILTREDGRDVLLHSACLRTATGAPFTERLGSLLTESREAIERFAPTTLALETLLFNTNQKTAMRVAEVRGALLGLALTHGLVICEYAPGTVKVAITGSGSASKTQVATMVPKLVTLDARRRIDDEMDAIAVGLTCLAHGAYPHAQKVPE
ncbi:crossover junction endodeoxyribonuclease RuvC [Patescibacteria group bacterium]|jgi:crossover junction endodeoxyribonuclease RuvC|nr:crossover junction endodeoxyribonuclease RuvC [Patescibacteria group bacterium]